MSTQTAHTRLQLLIAWSCLLSGISIYLLFRSREHLGFILLDSIGLGSVVDSVRILTQGVHAPEFVRFCLPDGLWTTSYILFSDYCNRGENVRLKLAWASVIPLIGCMSELLQIYGVMPGVYDILDLACYFIPLLIYYITITFKRIWTIH